MYYDFFRNQFAEVEFNKDKLAISGSDLDFDWNTLKENTERLAGILQDLKVPPSHPVVIFGHKEAFFPLSILACIHVGITYIPIDKIYPPNRVNSIINQSGSQIFINCSEVHFEDMAPIVINNKFEIKFNSEPDYSARVHGVEGEPLQYIMFTSGSTGEPKGVLISQKSFLTFVDWASYAFGFQSKDVFLNQAPFTFDVSLCDLVNSMMVGGTLVLTSTEVVKNQDEFFRRLEFYRCTVWTSTPSFAYLFLRHPHFSFDRFPFLHTFFFMGEQLPNNTCGQLRKLFPFSRILNAYGPTEATIITTLIDITDDVISQFPYLPIGTPKPESEILIDKIHPTDREGEIILVGDHVSLGYLNLVKLNSEKFLLINGKRAFRTGDLGFYENDVLFCLGRNDDQVKLHGFRIELDEISQVISKFESVVEAVTIALKKGNEVKKIISFVVLDLNGIKDDVKSKILLDLGNILPYYMIPSEIVVLESLPYSTSFKIDKNKLRNDYLTKQLGKA